MPVDVYTVLAPDDALLIFNALELVPEMLMLLASIVPAVSLVADRSLIFASSIAASPIRALVILPFLMYAASI